MLVAAEKILHRMKRVAAWTRGVTIRWGLSASELVDVVIFEATNMDYLMPLCGAAKTRVVDVPVKTLQISVGLLLSWGGLVLRGKSFQVAYYAALLRCLRPAIVITFIDNSDLFYEIARANQRHMRFLAIQNAARVDVVELPSEKAQRIFLPEFACFGDYEKDLYSSKGAQIGRFFPIGSLREAYFRRYWRQVGAAQSGEPYDYDLCVVAEASPGWNRMYPGAEDAIGKVAKYAVRFARENGLKIVIAGKRDVTPGQVRAQIHQRDAEVAWYEQYIGHEVSITPRVRDQFTTYGLISRSRLSLAVMSTALREAASRGSRVLFCNFSSDRRWDFCVEGIWSLKEDSYEAFAERVKLMLTMSDVAYREVSEKMARYIMKNDDQNPTNFILEKIISDAVATRARS